MWNIAITQTGRHEGCTCEHNVIDKAEAKRAIVEAELDIDIIEPGDFAGDWLAQLPGQLEFEIMNEGSFEATTPTGYIIRCDIDKEW